MFLQSIYRFPLVSLRSFAFHFEVVLRGTVKYTGDACSFSSGVEAGESSTHFMRALTLFTKLASFFCSYSSPQKLLPLLLFFRRLYCCFLFPQPPSSSSSSVTPVSHSHHELMLKQLLWLQHLRSNPPPRSPAHGQTMFVSSASSLLLYVLPSCSSSLLFSPGFRTNDCLG